VCSSDLAQNPDDIVIEFQWNDLTNQIDTYENSGPLTFTVSGGNTIFEATGTFSYPGDNCEYVPTVSLLFDDEICETASQTVVVWDTENNGGGNFEVTPDPANVCENSAFTVEFTDISRLNCDADFESDAVANGNGRHTQFVYGTNTGLTDSDRIKGLSLDDGGSIIDLTTATGAYSGGTSTINGVEAVYFGPIVDNLPPPLVEDPNNISFPISAVQDGANVAGNTFQVTLYNWNECNPYIPDGFGNPNYADAISINATITLVGAPDPQFDVQNDLGTINPPQFCIFENVNVINSTGPGPFDYNWVLYDGSLDTDPRIGDTIRLEENPTFVFETGGDKLIRLIASRNDLIEDGVNNECQFIRDRVINVSPDAEAAFEFFDPISSTVIDPDYCQTDPAQTFSTGIRDISTNVQPNTEFRYQFFDETGTIIGSNPASGYDPNPIADFNLDYSTERFVVVELEARNNSTFCGSFYRDTIFVYGRPQPDFVANTVCEGELTTFSGIADPITSLTTRVNDDLVDSYEWDFSYDGSTFNVERTESDNTDFDQDLGAAGAYDVALRMTTEKGGCSDLLVIPVTVNPVPDAQLAPVGGPFCPGDLITFTNNSSNTDPGVTYTLEVTHTPSSFFFSTGLTEVDTELAFDNPDDVARTYEAEIIAESSDGCTTTSNMITFDISPGEESNIDDPAYSVFGTNCSPWISTMEVDAETISLNAEEYTWTLLDSDDNILDGYPIVVEDSDPNFNELDYEIENTSATIMLYRMVLEAEKSGVCIANDTFNIQLSPQPDASFTLEREEDCERVNFFLEATQKGLANYNWELTPTPDQFLGSDDEIQISYNREANAGADFNATISLTTTNIASCESDPEIVVETIEKQRPDITADFTINPTELQLPETTVTITNNSSTGPGFTYLWDFGDGTTSTDQDPGSHEYTSFGTYQITLEVTDEFCTVETSQSLIVFPTAPILDFEADTLEGCAPFTVQFTNLSQFADPSTYLWEFGDGSISRSVNPTHTFFQGGNFTVRLRAENEVGQPSEIQKEEYITVNSQPFADFIVSARIVFIPDQEAIFNNISGNASSYFWNFGDGTTSTEENPRHAYTEEGFYSITLIASNDFGCVDTLFREAEIQAISGGEVNTPNAFTPNTSGPSGGIIEPGPQNPARINDVFLPRLEGVEKFRMFIFNQWGELIFESNSKNQGWDGYYRGRLAPAGVYVYKLELRFSDGQDVIKVGDVTLIR